MFPLYSLQSKIHSLPGISYLVSFSGISINNWLKKHFSFNKRKSDFNYITSTICKNDSITKIRYGKKEKVW
jgi:hypothetical protein